MNNMHPLWEKIHKNEELKALELEGFYQGWREGKTMNVSLEVVVESLVKQIEDFRSAWINYQVQKDKENAVPLLKKTLADLRNVAGCMFIKLDSI